MRLGVLDVGSNTVHFLVVDAYPGARPLPAFSHKVELPLAAHLEPDDTLSAAGEKRLISVVSDSMRIAEDKGVEEVMAFATSAIREAVNGDEVLTRVQERTGAQIKVLSGEHEARLTFLAARRWFGWSSGRLLVIDIGGGSLEVGTGQDEDPEVVVSLPLGAGRLTRDWLSADPPPPEEVRAMRKYVRAEIARQAGGLLRVGAVDHAVGTSKTFRQLARIAGAAPSSEGFAVRRFLKHTDVSLWAERLTAMDHGERTRLPGVSEARAAQMTAGAIVADAVMDLMGVTQLEICPWALREGVILKRLDTLTLIGGRGETPPSVPIKLKAAPSRTRTERRRRHR
jgi:exopolyphosphatase / guanosine-5'-triphosphate,3'-diphosphate pyrophosphatase